MQPARIAAPEIARQNPRTNTPLRGRKRLLTNGLAWSLGKKKINIARAARKANGPHRIIGGMAGGPPRGKRRGTSRPLPGNPPVTPLYVVLKVIEKGAGVPGVTLTVLALGVHVVSGGRFGGHAIATLPPNTASGTTLKL